MLQQFINEVDVEVGQPKALTLGMGLIAELVSPPALQHPPQLTYPMVVECSPALMPRRRAEPALLSAAAGERWDHLSRTLQPMRGRACFAQLLDIKWSQAATQTREVCMAFSGNMSHRHWHRPLQLHGSEPRHAPQWQHGLGLHHGLRREGRVLTTGSLSLLSQPPVPPLFEMLKLFCFSFSPSVSHILEHCSNSHDRQASGYPRLTGTSAALWHGTGRTLGVFVVSEH